MHIKQICSYLEGIDLSEKMLDQARGKGIYDELIKSDILTYLSNKKMRFNYFVATDVFNYVGDLSDVFSLIKSQNEIAESSLFRLKIITEMAFFLEKSAVFHIQKSISKVYVTNLVILFVILKPKSFVKKITNMSTERYIYWIFDLPLLKGFSIMNSFVI